MQWGFRSLFFPLQSLCSNSSASLWSRTRRPKRGVGFEEVPLQKQTPASATQDHTQWVCREHIVGETKTLLYTKSDHWSIEIDIVNMDWQQLSRSPGRSSAQQFRQEPYKEAPGSELGTFCMQSISYGSSPLAVSSMDTDSNSCIRVTVMPSSRNKTSQIHQCDHHLVDRSRNATHQKLATFRANED